MQIKRLRALGYSVIDVVPALQDPSFDGLSLTKRVA